MRQICVHFTIDGFPTASLSTWLLVLLSVHLKGTILGGAICLGYTSVLARRWENDVTEYMNMYT